MKYVLFSLRIKSIIIIIVIFQKLLNQEFKCENQMFKVDKSRPNVKDAAKFVAFLPRVPVW